MEGAESLAQRVEVSGAPTKWRDEDERDPLVLAADLATLV